MAADLVEVFVLRPLSEKSRDYRPGDRLHTSPARAARLAMLGYVTANAAEAPPVPPAPPRQSAALLLAEAARMADARARKEFLSEDSPWMRL